MKNYEKLLEEAYKNIKQSKSSNRFEIPKVKGQYEGKKTVLTNFSQIVSKLRRSPAHFQKFLLKELAVSGQIQKDRLILNKKVPREKINQKIEKYTKQYVLCKECKKPDTELIKKDRINFIHCLACGANHPISKI